MHLSTIRPKILFGIITLKVFKKCKNIGPNHYATILKNFGIEEIREILCTLQAHYVFCMHLWDVIIHI